MIKPEHFKFLNELLLPWWLTWLRCLWVFQSLVSPHSHLPLVFFTWGRKDGSVRYDVWGYANDLFFPSLRLNKQWLSQERKTQMTRDEKCISVSKAVTDVSFRSKSLETALIATLYTAKNAHFAAYCHLRGLLILKGKCPPHPTLVKRSLTPAAWQKLNFCIFHIRYYLLTVSETVLALVSWIIMWQNTDVWAAVVWVRRQITAFSFTIYLERERERFCKVTSTCWSWLQLQQSAWGV